VIGARSTVIRTGWARGATDGTSTAGSGECSRAAARAARAARASDALLTLPTRPDA